MLTKADLSSLKKVIRQEIVSESKSSQQSLRAEIKLSRMQIQSDIKNLASRVIDLEQQSTKTNKNISGIEKNIKALNKEFQSLKKNVVTIKKDVKKISKDMDAIIDFFDNDILELRSRTDRVEQFLKLPTSTISLS